MMTVVVPSPTSSSCVRLSSIMLLAAGWATSISRRMAWPSLVRTMPPMGSSSIFSMALGPRHDRMMSATVLAAVMLEIWALRPNCRSPPGVCVSVVGVSWEGCGRGRAAAGGQRTHDNHGRLHVGDVAVGWRQGKRRGVDWRRRGVSRYLSAASSSATTQKRTGRREFLRADAARHVRAGANVQTKKASRKPKPKRACTGLRATGQLKRARPAPAWSSSLHSAAVSRLPGWSASLSHGFSAELTRTRRCSTIHPLSSTSTSRLALTRPRVPLSPTLASYHYPPLIPSFYRSSLVTRHPTPPSTYPIYRIHHPCPLRRRRLPALPPLS
jgi:hypothetical protein